MIIALNRQRPDGRRIEDSISTIICVLTSEAQPRRKRRENHVLDLSSLNDFKKVPKSLAMHLLLFHQSFIMKHILIGIYISHRQNGSVRFEVETKLLGGVRSLVEGRSLGVGCAPTLVIG